MAGKRHMIDGHTRPLYSHPKFIAVNLIEWRAGLELVVFGRTQLRQRVRDVIHSESERNLQNRRSPLNDLLSE
jgi:hypothetical protein